MTEFEDLQLGKRLQIVRSAVNHIKYMVSVYFDVFDPERRTIKADATLQLIDKQVDEKLREAIFFYFQEKFTSEELGTGGNLESLFEWFIDPLDGTSAYDFTSKMLPAEWIKTKVGICVGLKYQEEFILGYVINPFTLEEWYALRDKGGGYIRKTFQDGIERDYVQRNLPIIGNLPNPWKLDDLTIVYQGGGQKGKQAFDILRQQMFKSVASKTIESVVQTWGSRAVNMVEVLTSPQVYITQMANNGEGEWDYGIAKYIIENAGGAVLTYQFKNGPCYIIAAADPAVAKSVENLLLGINFGSGN